MGVVSSSFAAFAESDGWAKLRRGPHLRKMFGAYTIKDCSTMLRKFRGFDDGTGKLGYDEFAKLVAAEDCKLLFVWDIFSQQNELIDSMELLTIICVFSSAPLEEKLRFLLWLFDESKTRVSTAAELAQLGTTVVNVLGRCAGVAGARLKDVSASIKKELPPLLPALAAAEQKLGLDAAFRDERCIDHMEVPRLAEFVRSAYERLPIAQPPPEDAAPPPSFAIAYESLAGDGGNL